MWVSWGNFNRSSKKKSKKPKAANWFEKLSAVQVKAILEAAGLPKSGSKAKQIERLLECPRTKIYATEFKPRYSMYEHHLTKSCGEYLSVTCLQSRCRMAGLSTGGGRYDLVLRLLRHESGVTPTLPPPPPQMMTMPAVETKKRAAAGEVGEELLGPKPNKKLRPDVVAVSTELPSTIPSIAKTKPKPPLEGEALAKRVRFRRQKLNKQIDERLQWKTSFRYMNGAVKGGRVDVDCSEPEVFLAMFDGEDGGKVKRSSNGTKLSRALKTDEEISDVQLYGKTYRYGAAARLMAPASVSLNNGKLSFSFKYTVQC